MILAYLPFLALGLCAAPWLMAMSRRFGLSLALGGVLSGTLILVMGSLFLSSALGLEPLPAAMAAAALAGATGLLVLRRTPGAMRLPQRSTVARWAPASIGALLWIGTVAVAPLIPGAAPLSWAMNGDTANNIHIARYYLDNNGLTTHYSVPLSGALPLLAMAPGRDGGSAAELLHHDLVAFTAVWTLEIALTAVLLGLVASALVPSQRVAITAIASTAGSLLATTWYVAGLPIEFGYLNVHLALPFVLASWLAFLQSARHPVVAIAVELGLGVLLLTAWTPLIVFTVAFVLAIMLRNRVALRMLRGRPLAMVVVSALVFFLPFAWLAVPALAEGIGTLILPGHGMPFTGWLLPPLIGGIVLGAVLLRSRSPLPLVDGAISLSAAAVAGIAVLLFISRHDPDPWSTYYPAKLTWLVTAALAPVAIGFAFRALVDFARSRRLASIAAAALAAASLVLASLGPPPVRPAFVVVPPLEKIALGSVWSTGDAAVAEILQHTRADRRDLLWQTGNPDEALINFWILEFNGADTGGDQALRGFSLRGYRELRDTGSYEANDIAELCEVVVGLEHPVFVYTANEELSAELSAACPYARATVVASG